MKRRRWDSKTKTKIVLEGLSGSRVSEICNGYKLVQDKELLCGACSESIEVFTLSNPNVLSMVLPDMSSRTNVRDLVVKSAYTRNNGKISLFVRNDSSGFGWLLNRKLKEGNLSFKMRFYLSKNPLFIRVQI